MNFNQLVKSGLQRNDKESGKSCTRYMLIYSQELKRPICVEIESDHKGELTIKLYDTKLPAFPEQCMTESIFAHGICQSFLNDEMPCEEPITILNASILGKKVALEHIETAEKYRRKGLASFALKLAQDYYTRCPEVKECLLSNSENVPYMYTSRYLASPDLLYQNKIEHNMGKVGDILSYAKSKILGKSSTDAYVKFLLKNHFDCDTNAFQLPIRPMRARNIIADELLDNDNAGFSIQIFKSPIEIIPEVSMSDCNMSNNDFAIKD